LINTDLWASYWSRHSGDPGDRSPVAETRPGTWAASRCCAESCEKEEWELRGEKRRAFAHVSFVTLMCGWKLGSNVFLSLQSTADLSPRKNHKQGQKCSKFLHIRGLLAYGGIHPTIHSLSLPHSLQWLIKKSVVWTPPAVPTGLLCQAPFLVQETILAHQGQQESSSPLCIPPATLCWPSQLYLPSVRSLYGYANRGTDSPGKRFENLRENNVIF
jgi:hypothetical protein